ncbi:MAG: glycosyltransferase family 2 protein [Elusimicrobia bacterium]|nr:glycosyltransferase family 2 protein [Elusimicrobiota bacterium]
MPNSLQLSVVVPVFNEAEVLPFLFQRLESALKKFNGRYEVILIDDGSMDSSQDILRAYARTHPTFGVVILSRNFGHQAAISAGLSCAKGEAVVVIDGDLQDPPELICELFDKLVEGYDVVYAVRKTRKGSFLKRVCYWGYYRCLGYLAHHPIPLDVGDFCIMSARIVRLINTMPEKDRFLRGLRAWIGFHQSWIEYDREDRKVGVSKYSFRQLTKLGLDGIFSSSDKPLRLSSIIGFVVSLGAIVFSLFAVVWRLWWGKGGLPGYASLASGIFFLGGVQLISIGILGEYIGRIFNQIKGRPVYIVAEEVNIAR